MRVEIEYEKPNTVGGATGSIMKFASIFLDPTAVTLKKIPEAKTTNVAASLDEPKLEYYDDLVAPKTKVQTQKKSMHSTKTALPTEPLVKDLCLDATKAKQHLPFLA